MAAINANIVVETTTLTLSPSTTSIGVTVEPINLNVSTTAQAVGGNIGQLQYNIDGQHLGGVPGTEFASGNLTLGANANVKLTGGTNGYFLQTDGVGNLSWNAGTSTPGAPGNPGGAATQVQYNDGTLTFAGATGFTYDSVSADVAMGANLEVFNDLTVAGTTIIQQAKEKIVQSLTVASGTINFDLLTSAIILQTTNAIADFTLNVRGNATTTLDSIMSVNQSMTLNFINKNGLTAYVMSDITIDGTAPTIKWTAPGNAGTGTINGDDQYVLNILKTAPSTFTVFASSVGYA